MAISNYPKGFMNGVTIRGVPITQSHPGKVFWVNNSSAIADGGVGGSDGNPGTYQKPFDTIDYAVGRCTAGRGDIIMVMPGHAETLSAAGALDLDVAGIAIIGLGSGTLRPTLTFGTAATTDIDIDAANITVSNLIFSANYADIAAAIDVNSTDFTLHNCHFQATATDMNFKICVQDGATTTSNRMTLVGNTCSMLDAADTHWVNLAGTGDGHIIADNILHGDWGTMCIGGAGVVTHCSILRNYVYNEATDADTCISVAATATGIIAGNMCTGGHASQGIVIGDMGSLENFYVLSTADLSGVIEPAIA